MKTTLYVTTGGGFGNVLFNFMMGYSMGKILREQGKDVDVVYIDGSDSYRPHMSTYSIFKGRDDIKIVGANSTTFPSYCYYEVVEKGFKFQKAYLTVVETLISRHCDEVAIKLTGYFQSYKYSSYPEFQWLSLGLGDGKTIERCAFIDRSAESIIPEMRDFLFKCGAQTSRFEEFHSKFSDPTLVTVMLHVRRGDYLKLQNYHPVQTEEYFKACIEHVIGKLSAGPGGINIMAFSDDVEYLREWEMLKGYNHVIVDTKEEVETFDIMRRCDHFIISNSSFSLLAYYFRESDKANNETIVCAPSKWFGKDGPQFDLDDMVPPSENRFIF